MVDQVAEQECFLAQGATQARQRNCLIAGSLTAATCLAVYLLGSFLVRHGIAQNFIIAALEIPFYIIAFFIILSTVYKKMEYHLSPEALLVHYGSKGYSIPYGHIRRVERLTHGQFFVDHPRGTGSGRKLLPSADPAARAFLFGPYQSFHYGKVYLCATQAENYLLLSFNGNTPKLLISPERFEEFAGHLEARRAGGPETQE